MVPRLYSAAVRYIYTPHLHDHGTHYSSNYFWRYTHFYQYLSYV